MQHRHYEVLTEVTAQTAICQDVLLQRLEEQRPKKSYSATFMMEATVYSEKSVHFYRITWHHIP
jgi:hypothetical protein